MDMTVIPLKSLKGRPAQIGHGVESLELVLHSKHHVSSSLAAQQREIDIVQKAPKKSLTQKERMQNPYSLLR